MMNTGFPGPRNVTPTQFLRQSPPAASSPGGLGAPTPTRYKAKEYINSSFLNNV